MNVFIVGVGYAYAKMYESFGDKIVTTIEEADVVQFTGGADVSPELYGEHKHGSSFVDRHRDEYEMGVYEKCLSLGKFMVGICRGGQFLNVMNGGAMYQDVNGHASHVGHDVIDVLTGRSILCTSTHHQMMRKGKGAILIARSAQVLSEDKVHMSDLTDRRFTIIDKGIAEETEVVYYPSTKSLCFQPHPEIVREGHPCRDYFFEVLGRFYNKEM